MGSVGFIMPLLSTLAALVIIVHSAEENYDRDYRVLRREVSDIESPIYKQPWKSIESEPAITQSAQVTPSDTWEDTIPEETVRRRRPVRKRKRRPQLPIEDDLLPQERYIYNEERRPHLQENIDRPRRRRKKMENSNSNEENRHVEWNDEIVYKPKRRRGQKRNRPNAGSWPELSEFSVYQRPERIDGSEDVTTNQEKQMDRVLDDEADNKKIVNDKIVSKVQINEEYEQDVETTTIFYDNRSYKTPKDEDRSLSEFSIESVKSNDRQNITLLMNKEKISDKAILLKYNIEAPKEKKGLDPSMLKALLKKSNGKSLSEILQQNNLSLSDLLNGREKAISILQNEHFPRTQTTGQARSVGSLYYNPTDTVKNIDTISDSNKAEENEHEKIESTTSNHNLKQNYSLYNKDNEQEAIVRSDHFLEQDTDENHRRGYMRRFPGGIRRKLRTRPIAENIYKNQLSRDLIALSSMKYKNNRNVSKSREWKDIMPLVIKTEMPTEEYHTETETEIDIITTTTPCPITETTTNDLYDTTTDSIASMNTETMADQHTTDYVESKTNDETQTATISIDINTEPIKEKQNTFFTMKQTTNAFDSRRQAINNRMKRKRVKLRTTTTTEIPVEFEIQDSFSISQFVTTSEFNSQPQQKTSITVSDEDFTTLEDYLTTESLPKISNDHRAKKPWKAKNITDLATQPTIVSTDDTAQFEIEEIFNDNNTSARLSKILKERNMTLKELVEHRERGSSHVHLADIFHNASKEPNPPEPFLSKSLIEPISKETYPLRALLEANLHDPKTTTIDPNPLQTNSLNIPIVMDFGNNVNENGENMGIASLFNNYTKTISNNESAEINYDSTKVTPYFNDQRTVRDGRKLKMEQDPVTLNDLITLMHKRQQKKTMETQKEVVTSEPISKILNKIDLDDEVDGDGLIILDDIQQLRDFESKPSSAELLDMKLYERNKSPQNPSVSTFATSNTRSVTVATASIIGLALVLFLLTYAILKWKHQSKIYQNKHGKEDEFLPTPVFESRKGHKNNSSTRSKSPMLATSNIYAIETIDTHIGSESPEYMWDTLRKPFQ